jgi:hypothetical protein
MPSFNPGQEIRDALARYLSGTEDAHAARARLEAVFRGFRARPKSEVAIRAETDPSVELVMVFHAREPSVLAPGHPPEVEATVRDLVRDAMRAALHGPSDAT